MEYIRDNIKYIRNQIDQAAKRSGRSGDDITLIAVTKTVELDRIQASIDAGIQHAGENKVQEFLEKVEHIYPKPDWHLIGHLQTNKVKYIVDKVSMIHSVDSEKLAREIHTRAQTVDRVVPILVQVNIADEDTKYGISSNEVESLLQAIGNLTHIQVKGLMTIAPYAENPEDNRIYFRQMQQLFVDIGSKNHDNIDMEFLSMGMTNDYVVAIEEGSNMVRIGTGIFGQRHYG